MIGVLLSIFLSVVPTDGAFLTQLQPRDSILIADQLEYGVALKNVEEGTQLLFPEMKAEEGSPVMLLSGWELDTLKVHRQKKGQPRLLDINASFRLTTFDEGEYELPGLAVLRVLPNGQADTLVFEPVSMTVTTLPVDMDTFELNDIKGQIRYPITFRELLPWMFGIQIFAIITIVIVCLVQINRKKGGVAQVHKDPAYIVALRKLDTYRGDKLWAAERQKAFYSGVTDTLREYIVSRYGISAMEMTTREIFENLKGSDIPQELYNELEVLFERSDYVKFAKYVASREENAATVPLAVRFVTTTYQSEVDEEASEESQTENGQQAEKQSQSKKEGGE